MDYKYLLDLALILLSTKLLGLVTRKFKMPQVVGALLAGIILGPACLGIIDNTNFIKALSEIGVIVLMFSAGMESDIHQLKKAGKASFIIAALGVVVPLVVGFAVDVYKRQALISALIHKPKLLVLDEPFVGLDPKAAHIVKQLMHEMCANGSAIFFSTHVLEVAEKLCNKIAIIKNGKLLRAGSLEDVKGDESLEDVFLELIDE